MNEMKQDIDRRHRASKNALRRILATAISFAIVFGVLSSVGGVTTATRIMLSGFVALSVLFLGPRIWDWILFVIS
jgi:hypothetical protein